MLLRKIAFSRHCQVKYATCLSGREAEGENERLSGVCPSYNQVSNLFTATCVGVMHNLSQKALIAQEKWIQQNKQTNKNIYVGLHK